MLSTYQYSVCFSCDNHRIIFDDFFHTGLLRSISVCKYDEVDEQNESCKMCIQKNTAIQLSIYK